MNLPLFDAGRAGGRNISGGGEQVRLADVMRGNVGPAADTGSVMFEAARRGEPGSEVTVMSFESDDSAAALIHFREQVPEGEKLMYYREVRD